MDPFLIKKPLATEKATDLSSVGKYVFVVKSKATKPEIKKAVREVYKADVADVNIVSHHAKRKRVGNIRGKQSGYKKAIVTLKKGQKIDIQ